MPDDHDAPLFDPDARWIRVGVDLFQPSHPLHPMNTGEPASRRDAWLQLVALATWKPVNGMQVGELRASVRYLATCLGWSKSRVARYLAWLEEEGQLERVPGDGPREPDLLRLLRYGELVAGERSGTRARTHRGTHRDADSGTHRNGDRPPSAPEDERPPPQERDAPKGGERDAPRDAGEDKVVPVPEDAYQGGMGHQAHGRARDVPPSYEAIEREAIQAESRGDYDDELPWD